MARIVLGRISGGVQGDELFFPPTMVALVLWLGAIHFNVALVLAALLFLPTYLSLALMILSLLLLNFLNVNY
ncbi:putative diacylglycerol O-acyltransferase [Dioscorea sansibarensis]